MKLDHAKVRARLISARVADWPRILPAKHRATPAGAGYGSSRFSSPSQNFRILYAGEDFATAFAEAVVRDRFEGKAKRYLYQPFLENLCLTSVSSDRALSLLDLTGAAAYEMGVDTDASRARKHEQGQALSEALYSQFPILDGLLFDSRLTAKRCIAIYDRALSTLTGRTPIALIQAAQLPAEIKRLDIIVRRARGYATTR